MENGGYFLGVDGGGSKTTAVIFDLSGHFAAGVVGDSINYYSIGMDAARKNMCKIIAELSQAVGTVRFKTAVIGMSALNSRADDNAAGAFADGIIDAEKVIMDSDLYIAMKALCANDECAVVIAGTGSMAIARSAGGEIKSAGGWGHILGDEGSGYQIGLSGIKAAIRSAEGGEETVLHSQCLEFFGIKDIQELIGIYYGEGVPRKRTASFATNVITSAERGDSVSISIIKEQANQLFKTAIFLVSSLNTEAPIGLWGGVFQHSNTFLGRFCSQMRSAGYRDVKLLPFTPEVGAIIACFEENGVIIDSNTLNLLKSTYNFYDCKVI